MRMQCTTSVRRIVFKIALSALCLGSIIAVLRQSGFDALASAEELRAAVNTWGLWGPAAYIAVYMIRPLVLLPASVAAVSAGMIWGPKQGFVVVCIAANLSAAVEFLLARTCARKAVEKMMHGRMAWIDDAVRRKGFMTVLLIRLVPNVPWDMQNLGLGLTDVRFREYAAATFLGIMPGFLLLVYCGEYVMRRAEYYWGAGLAVAAVLAVLAGRVMCDRKKRAPAAGRGEINGKDF